MAASADRLVRSRSERSARSRRKASVMKTRPNLPVGFWPVSVRLTSSPKCAIVLLSQRSRRMIEWYSTAGDLPKLST